MGPVLAFEQSHPLHISPAVEEFLAYCQLRGLSPRTLDWYKYTLEPFARFAAANGHQDAASVSERTVRAFLAEQASRVGPRPVNHHREAIYRLYGMAAGEGVPACQSRGGHPQGPRAKEADRQLYGG